MATTLTADSTAKTTEATNELWLLSMDALIDGSMIGGGVLSLPQYMAKGASPGPVIIGWANIGIRKLALAFVYQGHSTRKPKLDAGPYAYARANAGYQRARRRLWNICKRGIHRQPDCRSQVHRV